MKEDELSYLRANPDYTTLIDGNPCVQGYSDIVGVAIPTLYMVKGAAPTHEFMHLIWFLNHAGNMCPSGLFWEYQFIEHGGECDPLRYEP